MIRITYTGDAQTARPAESKAASLNEHQPVFASPRNRNFLVEYVKISAKQRIEES